MKHRKRSATMTRIDETLAELIDSIQSIQADVANKQGIAEEHASGFYHALDGIDDAINQLKASYDY